MGMIRINPRYDYIVFHKETMDGDLGLLEDEIYYFDFDKDCVYMYPNDNFGYAITREKSGVAKIKSHIIVKKLTNWFDQQSSFLMTVEKNHKDNSEHPREWILKIKS
jgi:hypothetical protein